MLIYFHKTNFCFKKSDFLEFSTEGKRVINFLKVSYCLNPRSKRGLFILHLSENKDFEIREYM